MSELTPDITAVAVVSHGVLRLTFADGTVGEVDVLDRMNGPIFDRARMPGGFVEVSVDAETGTIVWPDGADLAPDTLYTRVRFGLWPEQHAAAQQHCDRLMPSGNAWTATTVDQIERIDWRGAGISWHPVRRALAVNFVGIAAYTAQRAGDVVVEPHTEFADGRGQQEIYVVMRGTARFTIDGDQFDAPVGTLLRVDPQAHRQATAMTADTAVLALGGEPTFKPSPERARPHIRADPARAAEIIAELREAFPGDHAVTVGEALLAIGAGNHDQAQRLVADLVAEVPQLRGVLEHDPELRPLLPT